MRLEVLDALGPCVSQSIRPPPGLRTELIRVGIDADAIGRSGFRATAERVRLVSMKYTAILSTKGQLVIPRELRESRHWKPGTELEIEERDGGLLVTPVRPVKTGSWAELRGIANYKGPPHSIEDMDKAVLAEAKRSHRASMKS
jgi:AbrB family looped-hinge helix DNA binding protein